MFHRTITKLLSPNNKFLKKLITNKSSNFFAKEILLKGQNIQKFCFISNPAL